MSKREAGIIAVVIIAMFGVSFVFAEKDGVPFDEIWEAIFGVQEDIEDIQTTLDLHALIATLEARIVNLETNLGALEFVPGPQGITGPQGSTGLTGQEGPTGPMGSQGPEGHRGAIGPPGPAGEMGPRGETGEQGPTGPKGDTGDAGLGKPAYDSGWVDIKSGQSITLDTGDIEFELNAFVYVLGMTSDKVIHQLSLGGEYDGDIKAGLTWSMTKGDTIELRRLPEDVNWEQVRVMVWGLPRAPK